MIKKIKVASLFSGAGGLDYGFHNNPLFEIVFANDFMKEACETYLANFKGSESYLKVGDIADHINSIPNCDILLGGFPCQAFSIMGKRQGFSDAKGRGLQYRNCVKALELYKPSIFIFENVKGLLSHKTDGLSTLSIIKNDLESCGYNMSHTVIKMINYGVPQRRERVILVGIRTDIDLLPGQLLPAHSGTDGKSLLLKDNLIFGTPPNPDIPNHNKHTGNAKGTKIMWMSILSEGENIKDLSQEEIDARLNALGFQSHVKPKTLMGYRRLNGNEIAPTMMFGNTCLPIHPFEDRSISVREAAYLQGFPDDFKFCGGVAAQYKQVGNAVPPIFSVCLANHIANVLEKIYDKEVID